jgi:hypothetical protein
MPETLSEFAWTYLEIGACFGFGFGAACEAFTPEIKWDWKDTALLTFFWPITLVMVIKDKS